MSPPAVALSALTRRFEETVAVDQLDLTVATGEVVGLLGHNGAGKTTTVRLANGVLSPDAGSVRIFGLDPLVDGAKVRARTGVLTESPGLDDRLTARETLALYAELFGVPADRAAERIAELLATFELTDRAGDRVGTYSKGMRQRVALARALLHEPELLYLDEPTSGLDPVAAHRVREMIAELSSLEDRTVVLATHNLVEAEHLCDRVAVLEHGRLAALGTPGELARASAGSRELEVQVTEATQPQAIEAIEAALGLEAIRDGPAGIVVRGLDPESVPEAVAALVEAGVPVHRVAPREVSLEAFYLALHGEGSR